jgi:hypothetical protein
MQARLCYSSRAGRAHCATPLTAASTRCTTMLRPYRHALRQNHLALETVPALLRLGVTEMELFALIEPKNSSSSSSSSNVSTPSSRSSAISTPVAASGRGARSGTTSTAVTTTATAAGTGATAAAAAAALELTSWKARCVAYWVRAHAAAASEKPDMALREWRSLGLECPQSLAAFIGEGACIVN